MATLAAIKGKFGNIEYYQCTMKPKDLISRTETAVNYFSKEDWQEMEKGGQMQREPQIRYLTEIAPYLIRNKNRFFNSIVVLLDPKLCKFKSLDEYPVRINNEFTTISKILDFSYEEGAKTIGFLSVKDTGHMIILDGQHRMLAFRTVIADREKLEKILQKTGETYEQYSDHGVFDDDVSVIFVNIPEVTDQRQLFDDINAYAKPPSQKERIFMSPVNGYFLITQNFTNHNPINDSFSHLINKKGTSLPDRSTKLTTGKHLSEMVEFICNEAGYKFGKQVKPDAKALEDAEKLCLEFLTKFFTKIKAYYSVLKDGASIPELREPNENNKWSLLFKPMPQVALLQAIHYLMKNSDMDEDAIYRAINKIDWSTVKGKSQWEDIVLTRDGTILTGKKVQDRLKDMIIYFVLGKSKYLKLENGEMMYEDLLQRWKDCTNDNKSTELPEVRTK
jgi:DNA sulfur modification protein DndB